MQVFFYITCIFIMSFFLLAGNTTYAQDYEEINLAKEYYKKGELEKAKEIYVKLAKKPLNIPLIHTNYLDILLNTASFNEAERYLDRIIKKYPDNIQYQVDVGLVYVRQGKDHEAQKHINGLINEAKKDRAALSILAMHLSVKELITYSVEAYLAGRKVGNEKYAYALELANIYRLLNKKDLMVTEYLNFLESDPANLNFVKNTLQNLLTDEEDLNSLEAVLYGKVQKYPDKYFYNNLLIWVNIQQKNFYGAFIQARALDKRLKSDGSEILDVGQIALRNKDYKNAIKIFTYVIENKKRSPHYIRAKRYVIKAREELVKNSFPVDKQELRLLIADYEKLVYEAGVNAVTLEALRAKALLHAFYLDEMEEAVGILNQIIEAPRVPDRLKYHCKLDLGDIYLLTGQPWESTLLYAQVEKAARETNLGHEAKLRNARLSFYKGDFALAHQHLDVLKLATSREIANDAMALSLLIRNNTILDSSDHAMSEYAAIELMLVQHKTREAFDSLARMLEKYPQHSLEDEIYWLQAKIEMEAGRFASAITLLNSIIDHFGNDILGDDALFLTGQIYQEQLGEKEKAMEVFQSFLTRYPGSIYIADARRRFRELRGDFVY